MFRRLAATSLREALRLSRNCPARFFTTRTPAELSRFARLSPALFRSFSSSVISLAENEDLDSDLDDFDSIDLTETDLGEGRFFDPEKIISPASQAESSETTTDEDNSNSPLQPDYSMPIFPTVFDYDLIISRKWLYHFLTTFILVTLAVFWIVQIKAIRLRKKQRATEKRLKALRARKRYLAEKEQEKLAREDRLRELGVMGEGVPQQQQGRVVSQGGVRKRQGLVGMMMGGKSGDEGEKKNEQETETANEE